MNISLSRISSWIGGLILIFTVIYIIVFEPSSFNPDFGSYKILYEIITNQDFRFYFSKLAFLDYLVRLIDFTGNYNGFRLVLAFIELFLFLYVIKNLKISLRKFNIFVSLILSAFLLLKVHVQIREGLALLLWLFSLNTIHKEKYLSLKNISLFIVSSLLHTSTIVFWISTFILKYNKFSTKIKRRLIVILFAIVGLTIWPFFGDLLSLNYVTLINFKSISISTSKIIYWLSFILIFCIVFKNESSKITLINKKSIENINSSYIIGNIGFYGFIGFVTIAALNFFYGAPNAGSFTLIFRMCLNLLFLISFYRISSQPKSFYTNILNSFIFLIVFRLLFLPSLG